MTRQQSKGRRAKAAKTEAKVDEKLTPAPDQNPVSRLKALGGGDCDQWNRRIGHGLFAAIPGIDPDNAEDTSRAVSRVLLHNVRRERRCRKSVVLLKARVLGDGLATSVLFRIGSLVYCSLPERVCTATGPSRQ